MMWKIISQTKYTRRTNPPSPNKITIAIKECEIFLDTLLDNEKGKFEYNPTQCTSLNTPYNPMHIK